MIQSKKAFTTIRRNSSSSIALVILLVVVTAFGFNLAQSAGPSADIILEVIATHVTMASDDTYVYLRVFSDRTAESQFLRDGNSEKKELSTIKKTLAQDEFMRIKALLSKPKLAGVGPKYERGYAIIDSWTEWTIKIPRPEQPQIIHVLEFSPGLARIMKHPYPDALVKLGCNIQRLRAEISGERDFLDHECKRVIGTSRTSDTHSGFE